MDESISVNFTEFAVTTFIAKFGLVKNRQRYRSVMARWR